MAKKGRPNMLVRTFVKGLKTQQFLESAMKKKIGVLDFVNGVISEVGF